MAKSWESAEIFIDMLMVALMKTSRLLFILFEMETKAFHYHLCL